MRKPTQMSELERARTFGLVSAAKRGPRDVGERHSQYLKATLRRGPKSAKAPLLWQLLKLE